MKLPVTVEVPTVWVLIVALVMTAFVVVEFPTIRPVIFASVANKDAVKELVVVLLSAVSLVMYALVVVELPIMRSVIVAKVATRDPMKELEEVLLLEKRFVEVSTEAEAVFKVV